MAIKDFVGGAEMVLFSNRFHSVPDWQQIEQVFDAALEKGSVTWMSFGTMAIDKSETLSNCYDDMISEIVKDHGGELASALTIVHFENAVDNVIPEDVTNIYNKFISNNPQKKPSDFSIDMMVPTIHSDPVDGVYVQCTGSTLWTGFYGDTEKTYTLYPGDAIYIPKDVVHSVKTLEPRVGVSFGLV
jgi:mannose-6-phosphate isomerase-like protein (cupin superfamily)